MKICIMHTNDCKDNDFGAWTLLASGFYLYSQGGCFTSDHSTAKCKYPRGQRKKKAIMLRAETILSTNCC